jgi:microcystin-dependent protein
MARNGSGTYTVPNTFASGASITASGHNQNWSDAATELTNSVAADGQTAMTAPLKNSSGSAAAPSVTFAADTDTGFYRKAANTIGVSVGGTEVAAIDGPGLLVPVGALLPYAGSSAPTGYLLANGTAVSRTTYANLFAAIGTTYGTGDGSTTFNVPDCTGRVIAGKESAATRLTSAVSGVDGATLGSASGSQSHTLTIAELPVVTPAGTNSAPTTGQRGGSGGLQAVAQPGSVFQAGDAAITISAPTFTGTPFGSGNAHSIVQPTIVLNYIIKH